MSGTIETRSVSALMVGEYENDRLLLIDLFRKLRWRLFEARDRRRGMDCLGRHAVQVVLAESGGSRWNWRRILSDLRHLSCPPQLIVASRNADRALWAEVFNIGGYDVLPRPFQADEVERVVAGARRNFDRPAHPSTLVTTGMTL